jgi:protein gp37
MGDIFDANGDTVARARVFELTKSTPNLFWLLLTKRPQNIMAMLPQDWRSGYPNVGLGVTVENSRNCERAVILSRIPAVMRFLSLEPLLESIQVLPLIGIDWVICGGESGLNFRGFSAQWAREIRDQCMLSNVAFFYKQNAGIKPEKMPLLDGLRYAQLPAILTP